MTEGNVLKIEGISPDMLWVFCFVLVGLMALIVLGYKVIEIFRKEHDRKAQREKLNGTDITEQIADKVTAKVNEQIDKRFADLEESINKRFGEIDTKLSSDKETLRSHTTQLNDHESRVSKLEGGSQSLCQGMLALLEADPAQAKAAHAMKNYLINGRYNEKDWE